MKDNTDDLYFKYCSMQISVISIWIMIVVFMYGINKLQIMINRNDTNTSFNKVNSDLSTSSASVNLGTSGFYFGVTVRNSDGSNLLADSTYLNLQMNYVTVYY